MYEECEYVDLFKFIYHDSYVKVDQFIAYGKLNCVYPIPLNAFHVCLFCFNFKLDSMSDVVDSCLHDWQDVHLLPTVGLPTLNYHLDYQHPCDNFAQKIDHHDMRLLNLHLRPISNSIYLLH